MYTKNKTKQLVIRLSQEQFQAVEYFSNRFNGSKSDFIRLLIDWFASMGGIYDEKK